MLPELETKLALEKKILGAHHKDHADNETMLRQVKTLEAKLQQVLEQMAEMQEKLHQFLAVALVSRIVH